MEINLSGFYGHNNYGDTLMLHEIINILPDIWDWSFLNIYSDRDSSESVHYNREFKADFDKGLNLVGGGGIVTPNFWFFKHVAPYLKQDAKIGLFNVNLTSESIEVLKKYNYFIKFAVVRDSYSSQAATSILKKDRVLLAPDISFLSPKIVLPTWQKPINYVSICLNGYVLNNYFSTDSRKRIYAEKLLIELAEFVKWLKTFGHKIQLIQSQVDREINDNRVSAILDGLVGGVDNWVYSNDDLETKLFDSSLIISMRYHTTLFAIKHAIPFIDISHHSKSIKFLEEMGLSDFSINYWNCSLDKFKDVANKVKYSTKIKEVSDSISVSSIESWNHVKQTLSQTIL